MAQAVKTSKKKETKPFEPLPHHLDWFEAKGLDVRICSWKAHNFAARAKETGRTLSRKSLKKSGEEMDSYIDNYRSAEQELSELVSRLSDPKLKSGFLSGHPNISSESYDKYVKGLSGEAKKYGRLAWRYERAYSKQYGKMRPRYKEHLAARSETRKLVRLVARRTLERLEGSKEKAGGTKLAAVYSPRKNASGARKVEVPSKEAETAKSEEGKNAVAMRMNQLQKRIDRLKAKREKTEDAEKARLTRQINELRKERKTLKGEAG